ncbi:hypothetical protein ScPMuIL_009208 [Solemya velum]
MSTKSKKRVDFADSVDKAETQRQSRSKSRNRSRDRRTRSQDVRSTVDRSELPLKRERSLICMMRNGSRNSVRSLVKLFEQKVVSRMNEGRKSQIVFPDDRRLDILIQPKLNAGDLLALVASHFKLKEKEYFGLAFIDETGHYSWLQLDKRVLEHDFPRTNKFTILVLFFSVRFYVECISALRDISTVELFYLNATQAVFKGQIECDSETVFTLAAHVLQATHGDYFDDPTAKSDLKKLPVIPTNTLKEHPSISYCEERVIEFYRDLSGISRGQAIVNYMTIVEGVPTYGIHYYEVKDKKDIPWVLGISCTGIGVYDKNDKTTPRKLFLWKQLENLYYRDKKFSIEVHDQKRIVHTLSSFNLYEDAIREPIEELDELSDAISDPTTQVSVSRRTFGPGNVNVHAWFASTQQLTKCIWSMGVAQHQFYLERKHSKTSLPSVRSVSEIAAELSRSTASLPGSLGSDLSHSGSSTSLPSLSTSRFDLNFDPVDSQKVQRDMYEALKARKEALEEALRKKTEEVKQLCIKEGELTGVLPADIPLAPGEHVPQIRRRVGTAFTLSSKIIQNDEDNEDALSTLELEVELQRQITSAAHKLAQDKSVGKNVRKQRRQCYTKATTKLKDMEKKLFDLRNNLGKATKVHQSVFDESESSPAPSPPVHRYPNRLDGYSTKVPEPRGPAMSPSHTLPGASSSPPTLSPTHSSPQLGGYKPNPIYTTRIQYRNQMAPYHSSLQPSPSQQDYENIRYGNRFDGSQDSGFSSANNMYNVNSQRTSHYDSTDEMKTPTNPEPFDGVESVFENRIKLPSKHGSLDGTFRKSSLSSQKYGSLERKTRKRDSGFEQEKQHSDSDLHVNVNVTSLEPTRFGSKRDSLSDSEPRTPKNNMIIELPVSHEVPTSRFQNQYSVQRVVSPDRQYGQWEDSTTTEPSPIIQSPNQQPPDPSSPHSVSGQLYSPNSQNVSIPPTEHSVNIQRVESPHSHPQTSTLVTVRKLQPHIEISKPFEMSDFYKYSEKLRRQRRLDLYQQQLIGSEKGSPPSTPSQHSSDGGDSPLPQSSSTSFAHPSINLSPSHRKFPSSSSTSSSYSTPVIHQSTTSSHYSTQKPEFEQSYSRSSSYSTVKEHGSSRMQYSVQTVSGQKVTYKQVQTSKHTQYRPLTPMKCESVRNTPSTSSAASRR